MGNGKSIRIIFSFAVMLASVAVIYMISIEAILKIEVIPPWFGPYVLIVIGFSVIFGVFLTITAKELFDYWKQEQTKTVK